MMRLGTARVRLGERSYAARISSHGAALVADAFLRLGDRAVVVTDLPQHRRALSATRSTQGLENLRAWYTNLFNTLLPEATFRLSGYSGTGNSRHVTWTASSTRGRVNNGGDTFGLIGGKINYHYSFLNIQPLPATPS